MQDWYCELCGKKLENTPTMFLTFARASLVYDTIDLELCDECAKSFEEWANSRKDVTIAKGVKGYV